MSTIEVCDQFGEYIGSKNVIDKKSLMGADAIIANKHLTGEKICEELFNTSAIKSIFGGSGIDYNQVIIQVSRKGVIYDVFEE